MVETSSANVPIGTKAYNFTLPDAVSEQNISLVTKKSNIATVIIFMCNHCPYVKHLLSQLVEITDVFKPKGINFIAINSNDTENFPDDSPVNMKKLSQEYNFSFPYLFDQTQEVAKQFQATCTPDFFIYDQNLSLVYHGQFDDSRPHNNIPVTGDSIKKVLNAVINKQPIPDDQEPSIGCNIKWKE